MRECITKGIVLSGGIGSRLYPLTKMVSKQLLPVYDKPMIYYSLSTLMLAGIKEILIITAPDQLMHFESLLGDGNHLGITITYSVQPKPSGISQAFILAEEFLAGESSILILGDNIFYGHKFEEVLKGAMDSHVGASVFTYQVNDPSQYGVIEYDGSVVKDIIEKPERPPSRYAVTGLYICDNKAVQYAKDLKPSDRGELEITDLLRLYIQNGELSVTNLCRGIAWLDAGTQDDLLAASQYIAMLEQRQGQKICCPEEIAWRKGYITDTDFENLINSMPRSKYTSYLMGLYQECASNVLIHYEGVLALA